MSTEAVITRRPAWTPLELPAGGHRFVHARGAVFETTDPATGEVVAHVAASEAADVDDAVAAARRAGRAPQWRDDASRRGKVLWRFAEALRANASRARSSPRRGPSWPARPRWSSSMRARRGRSRAGRSR